MSIVLQFLKGAIKEGFTINVQKDFEKLNKFFKIK